MKIIYCSDTGNTEKMAKLIKSGIEAEGKQAELIHSTDISVDDIKDDEILIIGCPACGDEELDELDMESFVESLDGNIRNKKVALFGSYGWGDGEWMRQWEERMESYGASLIREGLIKNYEPEDDDKECIDFGKLIANIAK